MSPRESITECLGHASTVSTDTIESSVPQRLKSHGGDTVVCVSTLSKRLELARSQRGWSKRDLSLRAGLSDATYRNLLSRGSSGRSETVNKLASALGVSPGWLLTGEGEPFPEDAEVPEPAGAREPAAPDDELDELYPATLGERRGYKKQELRARAEYLQRHNTAAPDTVWLQIARMNSFATANTPPSIEMLVRLAEAIMAGGEPDLDPTAPRGGR